MSSADRFAPWLNPDTDICCGTPGIRVLPTSYYDHYLSDAAKRRLPSPLLTRVPGTFPMFSDLPTPETFPFRGLTLSVTHAHAEHRHQLSNVELNKDLLEEALKYTETGGMPKFLKWLYGLQERYHKRRYGAGEEGWSLSVGCGGHDLLFKAFTCLLDEGDSVLVEAPVSAEVVPILRVLKCHVVEVATDANGIVADDLERTLQNWPVDRKLPKFLYTVPYGSYPTTTLDRRSQVLKLARGYKFLILEDDPHFYLYYGSAPRVPSYFQLERDIRGSVGHVMRFDSFSKIISSGTRMDFVSGPTPIVKAIDRMTSFASFHPPGITQAVTYSLLKHWGYKGFDQHVTHLASVYCRKRNLFIEAMNKHLKGLGEWSTPEAGMYVWFKLSLPPVEVPGSLDIDLEDLFIPRRLREKIVALPGASFFTNVKRRTAYVKASFSSLDEEHFDDAMRRLAGAVAEVKHEARRIVPHGYISSRL